MTMRVWIWKNGEPIENRETNFVGKEVRERVWENILSLASAHVLSSFEQKWFYG